MNRRILRHLQSVRPSQRIVAVIQARLGSSRFPRKSLALFRGRPIIEHVIERVCRMPLVDEVVVAVPTKDAELVDAVTRYGSRLINTDAGRRPVSVVCGPEKDVLMRYWLACTAHKADVVTALCGRLSLVRRSCVRFLATQKRNSSGQTIRRKVDGLTVQT